MPQIYLDHNASTPLLPEVLEAMAPWLRGPHGNPSSGHWAGAPARKAIERARGQVAGLIGATPDELVFTSGGSEANNWVVKGVALAAYRAGNRKPHVVCSAVEHPSVLGPGAFVEALGGSVTLLPVDPTGRIDPDDLAFAIGKHTVLVSVMHANNEVGTIEPVAAVARIAREHGVPLHCDAAQSVGKIPVDVTALGVDFLTIAGHKLYAPKGVGALYLRAGAAIEPLVHGAGHERGRRAGTENVLGIVALGQACEIARTRPCAEPLGRLRDHFHRALEQAFGERLVLNGHPTERLPNTLNVSLLGADASALLAKLERVAASTGSACHTGSTEVSPVLAAMGVGAERARGAIRFSVGRGTTREQIDRVVTMLREAA